MYARVTVARVAVSRATVIVCYGPLPVEVVPARVTVAKNTSLRSMLKYNLHAE